MDDSSNATQDAQTTAGAQRPNAATGSAPTGENATQRLKQQGNELLEYCAFYLETQKDQLRLHGRKLVHRVELAIVAILVAAGAVLVGITLLFLGIAQGLAQVFTEKPWLGFVVAGVLLLVGAGVGAWLWTAGRQFLAHKETIEKYEQRKRQQQARFGHDVAERALASRSNK